MIYFLNKPLQPNFVIIPRKRKYRKILSSGRCSKKAQGLPNHINADATLNTHISSTTRAVLKMTVITLEACS